MSRDADIVAAIATPAGRGGIGVVRVSGKSLADFARTISGFVPPPRRAERASFLDAQGMAIDDGLMLYFPSPASFTGEDVLELHGHGGPVLMRMLLKRCLELGARLAEPGEFSRRAFLNDKLDLAQAEAVADLIEAASERAARSALRSLRGEFSQQIETLTRELIELRALVEAMLDFPEDEVDAFDRHDAQNRLAVLRVALDETFRKAKQGSALKYGLKVVIAGQPNVGKSSLLNRLAGEERAIVTAIPGTTRDSVHESIAIEGVPLDIVDTAGLRDTADEVERIGIERTWHEIGEADVLLLVCDARGGLTPADEAILVRMPARLVRVLVFNKIDLAGGAAGTEETEGATRVRLSAKTGAGLENLRALLLRLAGWETDGEDVYLARERHLVALGVAAVHLASASGALARPELFAEELRLAQAALNAITGEFTADDLLGEIFSRFCIGK